MALEPAAIEASLAAAVDLGSERKALDQHWGQRLERARHQVDQGRHVTPASSPRIGWWPAPWSVTGRRR